VEAISITVAYYQHLVLNEQAAVWTGTIIGDPHLDEYFDLPIYARLETALGSKAYRQALDQGKTRSIDDVVVQIMNLLNNPADL
jgi:hypothetical protein